MRECAASSARRRVRRRHPTFARRPSTSSRRRRQRPPRGRRRKTTARRRSRARRRRCASTPRRPRRSTCPRRRPRTARRPPSPSTADGQANALAVDRRRPGDRGRPGVAAADAGLRRPAAADVVELLASRRIPLDGGGVRRHVGNVGPAAV